MMSLSLGITVFQVDGTELVSESRGPLANKPKNSFPFKRLASSNQENSTTVYLYHQLDEVTFAEEVYDSSRGLWTTAKNITIEA